MRARVENWMSWDGTSHWVGGINTSPLTRANSIQARRPNNFRSASIIAKNCTEGLPDKINISLDESKRKITLKSWIAWIGLYMEDNGMDTVFRVYDPDLKTEFYILDEWVAA